MGSEMMQSDGSENSRTLPGREHVQLKGKNRTHGRYKKVKSMSLMPFSWDSLENDADKYSLLFLVKKQIILETLAKAHHPRTVCSFGRGEH